MAVGSVASDSVTWMRPNDVKSPTKVLRMALTSCVVALGMIALLMVAKGAGSRAELESAGLIAQEAVTSRSTRLASVPEAVINKAATAAVKTIAEDSLKSTATAAVEPVTKTQLQDGPVIGNADMTREIAELGKQEKIHFEARQKALQSAMDATTTCAEDDKACQEAHQHVAWKMAKDKYEQAAMTDITKENDAASASAQGQVMFNNYAKLADALSGTKGFNNLYNATTSAEREKDSREKAAIASLRQEQKDLHKLEMEKRNLRHAEQAKAQVRANAEEKANIENELSGITNGKTYVNMYEEAHKDDAAKQFADAKAIKEAREERDAYRVAQKKDVVSAKELNAIDSNPYKSDMANARAAEQERSAAFKKYVGELHAQDVAAREQRQALLAKEHDKHAAQAVAAAAKASDRAASGGANGQYTSDVSAALRMDAKKESLEEAAIKSDQARDAKLKAEEKGSAAGSQAGKDAKAAPVMQMVQKPDIMSSEGYEAAVATAQKVEMQRAMDAARVRDAARVSRAKVVAARDVVNVQKATSDLAKTADSIVGIFSRKQK